MHCFSSFKEELNIGVTESLLLLPLFSTDTGTIWAFMMYSTEMALTIVTSPSRAFYQLMVCCLPSIETWLGGISYQEVVPLLTWAEHALKLE